MMGCRTHAWPAPWVGADVGVGGSSAVTVGVIVGVGLIEGETVALAGKVGLDVGEGGGATLQAPSTMNKRVKTRSLFILSDIFGIEYGKHGGHPALCVHDGSIELDPDKAAVA